MSLKMKFSLSFFNVLAFVLHLKIGYRVYDLSFLVKDNCL